MGTSERPDRLRPPAEGPAVGLLHRIAAAVERIAEALDHRWPSAIVGLPPEGLSKEDAARFVGVDMATIEHLIRTRKLAFVQYGRQRGRIIPVASLRKLLNDRRQEVLGLPGRSGHG